MPLRTLLLLLLLPLLAVAPPPSPPPSSGLTMDDCRTTRTCAGKRLCRAGFRDDTRPCTPDDDNCLCLPTSPLFCTAPADCPPGELCARESLQIESPRPFCASAAAIDRFSTLVDVNDEQVPTPAPDDDPSPVPDSTDPRPIPAGLCIAADALAAFAPADLAFAAHPRAVVLCDPNGSCATPGHLVVLNGTPMMMATYCKRVTCSTRDTLVNSPRYRRALRIPSNTDGLVFTAFAARYATRAEEGVLTAAVHMGL